MYIGNVCFVITDKIALIHLHHTQAQPYIHVCVCVCVVHLDHPPHFYSFAVMTMTIIAV